ncbi:hypothetical protein L596_007069 [Steinernema carpocapsae]|uniref:Uncharacterized protein n=1 Tax=Steinernema carpocapsae TaxID=34508 RepID=A0A4U5P8V6_STECR|nr:hypothetical protein L596_007069 [Steinernema carpocapsae]
MDALRRGGSSGRGPSQRKRSFVFSTTDVQFWTTRSASNINQIGLFHQHFPGKRNPPQPSPPVYYPNPSTSSSSNVVKESYFQNYESEPRRGTTGTYGDYSRSSGYQKGYVSGYSTLPINGTTRKIETTETTE